MKFTAADSHYTAALARYNARYDNALYVAATHYLADDPNKNTPRQYAQAQRLTNAALALCGSPFHHLFPQTIWSQAEVAFLSLFL